MHACIHTYTHAYIHAYLRTYVHIYTPTYLPTYVRKYGHTYIHMYVYIYIHKHACMHPSIRAYDSSARVTSCFPPGKVPVAIAQIIGGLVYARTLLSSKIVCCCCGHCRCRRGCCCCRGGDDLTALGASMASAYQQLYGISAAHAVNRKGDTSEPIVNSNLRRSPREVCT